MEKVDLLDTKFCKNYMVKAKIAGLVAGASSALMVTASAFAAAPTAFDMSLATSTMDITWDTFVDVVGTLVPYVLPIVASAAVFFGLYRLGKRILFGGTRG